MITIKSAEEHKRIDCYTMDIAGVPGMVLMERAAMELVQEVTARVSKTEKICAVCGNGNNGGDGMAAARILTQRGYCCDIYPVLGSTQNSLQKETELCKKQRLLAERAEVQIRTEFHIAEYTVILDAMFGIGLSKEVAEPFHTIIDQINEAEVTVIAVDIPSGIHPDTGKVLGCAVRADCTITFGYGKPGLFLYPGAEYAGNIKICEIGFFTPTDSRTVMTAYEKMNELTLPKRKADSNKGSYGKILIIAGFGEMSGACCMTALAAYRSGAGLVRVITSEKSAAVIRVKLPEAMVSVNTSENYEEELKKYCEWADVIAIGPGLGMDNKALFTIYTVLLYKIKRIILDADAINLLANELDQRGKKGLEERLEVLNCILPENTILTPHLLELSRLTGIDLQTIKSAGISIAEKYASLTRQVFVCKDARTLIVCHNQMMINLTGNNGMATGGSGDVLTGIIAGFAAGGADSFAAAAMGVFVHATAGDKASRIVSSRAMMAGDIIEQLQKLFCEGEM